MTHPNVGGSLAAAPPSPPLVRAWAIAFILMLLSMMSFLDRQVLALLVPDLRRDLGLSDINIGILVGPAFVGAYNLSLLVASFLVDRWNRTYLIAAGVILWCLMTCASAFAQSFGELIVLRAGLAVGEALLGPAAISLIGDLFPPERRNAPTALYVVGSAIGSSGSAVFTAAMLQAVNGMDIILPRIGLAADWRLTLIGVGAPGLLLAVLLLVFGREPRRGAYAASGQDVDAAKETLVAHLLRHGVTYLTLFVAVGLLVMLSIAIVVWGPAHLMRAFGLAQVQTGYIFGVTGLVAGVIGALGSVPVVKRFAPRGGSGAYARILLVAIPIGVAAVVIGGFGQSVLVCMIGFGLALFILPLVSMLPLQFLQATTPSRFKGRISAGLFFIFYILSAGLGPVLVPLVAGQFQANQFALGHSLGIVAILAGLASAAMAVWLAYSKPEGGFAGRRGVSTSV